MKFKNFFIFIFIFICPQLSYSQSDDFGIWYGVNAEYSLNKKLDISISTMIRTFNNASKIEQGFLEGGVSYKFNKYLSAAGSYRISDNLEDDSEFHIRHKWFADVKGALPLKNFSFSARIRFQVQAKTYFKNEADRIPGYTGRIKVKAIYKIPDFPVNPYLSIEYFCPMFENADRLNGKSRYALGFDYKISKKHSVSAEYIFQRDYLPHISDINIIALSYNFKIK
jgi:hypothetical protein